MLSVTLPSPPPPLIEPPLSVFHCQSIYPSTPPLALDPLASHRPSGENAQNQTSSLWPSNT